jgi:hypothetical protein
MNDTPYTLGKLLGELFTNQPDTVLSQIFVDCDQGKYLVTGWGSADGSLRLVTTAITQAAAKPGGDAPGVRGYSTK